MIKLKSIIIDESMNTMTPAYVQPAGYSINIDFVNFIKNLENQTRVGYDKEKNLWFPHESSEGGKPTIAYGHKIKNDEFELFKKGITEKEATRLLVTDILEAKKMVNEYIKRKYGITIQLTQKQGEILIEFAFNLGGLDKFPKFVDAVLRNDWKTARKEYKRFGAGRELKTRNERFFDRYLK